MSSDTDAFSGMLASDHRVWAKEEILHAIDQGLAEKFRTALPDDLFPDDRHALLLQRNRVAKFLGLPQVNEVAALSTETDTITHATVADIMAGIDAPAETAFERQRLVEALRRLVNAEALAGVRGLVAGWNGEDRSEGPFERHPKKLGATLPKTNCGAIYDLDEALTAARAALPTEKGR